MLYAQNAVAVPRSGRRPPARAQQHCGTALTFKKATTMPPDIPLVAPRTGLYDTLTGPVVRQNGTHLEVGEHDAAQHARHVSEEEGEHGGQGGGGLGQPRQIGGRWLHTAQQLHQVLHHEGCRRPSVGSPQCHALPGQGGGGLQWRGQAGRPGP